MSGNTRLQCKLCEFACSEIAEIIDHMIFSHLSNELSFRKRTETGSADSSIWQTENFRVVPSVIKDNGFLIDSEGSDESPKYHRNTEIPLVFAVELRFLTKA